MVRLIRESNDRGFRNSINEETRWNQIDQTARQVVRRALKNNGIQLMSEYDNEEQSRYDKGTNIRIKRVFTTDLTADDMYDKKPDALVSAVREIKDRLGKDYSVLALPNSDDNWEVIVSKIALESKSVRRHGKRVVEDVSSRSMIYMPVKRKDCGDSECVVFAEVEDVDDPIDVYFCAVLPYDWENSEYDPNEGEVEGTYFTNRMDAMRWFNGY